MLRKAGLEKHSNKLACKEGGKFQYKSTNALMSAGQSLEERCLGPQGGLYEGLLLYSGQENKIKHSSVQSNKNI